MEKTIIIKGMMCAHCVAHVTEALTKVKGVRKVDVSLERGDAKIEAEASVKDSALKKAVEAAGYEVVSIQND